MAHYSHSAVRTYRECMFKYDIQYRQRLNLVTQRQERLDSGTIFHKAMQLMFTGHAEHECYAPMQDWIEQKRKGFKEGIALLTVKNLLDDYMRSAKDEEYSPAYDLELLDFAYMHELVLSVVPVATRAYKELHDMGYALYVMPDGSACVEHEIVVDAGRDVQFKGVVDCVLTSPYGTPMIVDFKLRESSLSLNGNHDFDTQTALYQHAFYLKHGIRLNTAAIYQIVQAEPRKPEITKKGQVARHKIVSSYELFLGTIIENGQNPEEYAELLEYYKGKKFSHIHTEIRDEETLQRTWEEFLDNIDVISLTDNTDYIRYPRNIGYQCARCPISTYCMMSFAGAPVDHLIIKEKQDATASTN